MLNQLAFACSCGATEMHTAGLCARCYWARCRDQRFFDGLRYKALQRDRVCLVCGAAEQLIVHHRRPPVATLRLLVTLCRRCHPRIHRLNVLPAWSGDFMRQLWREANPETPEQLPLGIGAGAGKCSQVQQLHP
ncbi:MAG: HNH endonuclease [Acidobacteriota bacterium]|nr:HNH endonuclease [Acidobacteriota bacterium]